MRLVVLAASALLGLSPAGCVVLLVGAGAAAGAGVIAYTRGELKASEATPLDTAWSATLGAMERLELSVTQKSRDRFSARVVARGSGDRKIQVSLRGVSEKVTEIRIRVDVLGDEALSRRVLAEIRKGL